MYAISTKQNPVVQDFATISIIVQVPELAITFVMMLEKLLVGGAASHDGASCLRLIAPGITNQYSFRLVAAK